MDLSEYIREILKKIPEKINIKSPDPGQVVMYLVLGILGVFVFITFYGLWHPFSWTEKNGIRLFPKECCSERL